jgi:multicomponent K+:H+ antiporter subunit A
MFMHDIKGLLAYSTISHLGLITLLIGMGSEMAMAAALFHLVCHALFKAPLFMMAGYVDQATGSRDMQLINGLWRWMPALMIVTLVPAAAMAGLPLMSGYLSKKMLFSESLLVTAPHWADVVIPAWVTVAGLFSVAYSVRIFHNVFFNGQPRDLPVWPPKRKPAAALLPLAILATLSPDHCGSPSGIRFQRPVRRPHSRHDEPAGDAGRAGSLRGPQAVVRHSRPATGGGRQGHF